MQDQLQPAHLFFNQLQGWMNSFHSTLRQDEYLVAYYEDPVGNTITIRQIGFNDPHMIVLVGDDPYGNRSMVLAHVATVQIVLKALKYAEANAEAAPTEPKKLRIGFIGDKLSFSPEIPTR